MSTQIATSTPAEAVALDPVTLTVLQAGLQQVCNEMDLAFQRAAFSPVISETLDRSDGIYRRETGELIAQGRRSSRAPATRSRATSISSTTPIWAARI